MLGPPKLPRKTRRTSVPSASAIDANLSERRAVMSSHDATTVRLQDISGATRPVMSVGLRVFGLVTVKSHATIARVETPMSINLEIKV